MTTEKCLTASRGSSPVSGASSDPFTFDLQVIRVTKGTEDPQREALKESQEPLVYQVRTVTPQVSLDGQALL